MDPKQYVLNTVFNCDDRNGYDHGNNWVYDLKIDIDGNVFVMYGSEDSRNIQNPGPHRNLFSIIDNIKIPDYVLSMYKDIINPSMRVYAHERFFTKRQSVLLFLEIVKILKTNVKENIENPSQITDLPTQLECAYKKIDFLEENYAKMEQKLKQINENYIISLQDVNNLQNENIKLKNRIKELEKSKEQIRYIEIPVITEIVKDKIIYVKTKCIDSDSDSEDEESSTNIQITSTSEV